MALCSMPPLNTNVTDAPAVIVTLLGVKVAGNVNTVSFVDSDSGPTVSVALPVTPETLAEIVVVPAPSVDTFPV